MSTPTLNRDGGLRVLAIDPGYGRCGFAVLEGSGADPRLISSFCLETPRTASHAERLRMVGDVLLQTVDDHNPDAIAIEELFFSVNAKTALRVAEVRGALLYLSASRSLPIIEFNPSAVKIATTGYGKATKAQVTEMVARLIGISIKGKLDDEIDAIALGITALAHHRSDVVNRVS